MVELVVFAVAVALGIVVAVDLRRAGPGLDLELIFQLAMGVRGEDAMEPDLQEWLEAPECAPDLWLGADTSWADWEAGGDVVDAALRYGFERVRLWVFAVESDKQKANALLQELPGGLEGDVIWVPDAAAPDHWAPRVKALLEGLSDQATRVWTVGLGAAGTAQFSALRASPELRDRLHGVLFWDCVLDVEPDDFSQDAFDLELNRTVPYLWIHSTPASAPLAEPAVPPSGRKPIAVVSLGGIPDSSSMKAVVAGMQAAFLAAQRVME